MSLLWIDGFEQYAASSSSTNLDMSINYVPNVAGSINASAGRYGGTCITTTTGRVLTTKPFGAQTELIVACSFKRTGTAIWPVVQIKEDSGATTGYNYQINSDGSISVRKNATVIATSAAGVIVNSTWHYIEFKVVLHNSAGSYELRLDEAMLLSGSGLDTTQGGGTCDRIDIAGSTNYFIDDLVVMNTAGSVNNNFLGDRKVLTLFPNGAGDSTEFTPSTGSNYAQVDEHANDGNTTYVEASTTDDLDLYTFDDLSALDSIDGIQIGVVARKTDTDNFDAIPVVKRGGTEYDQSTHTVDNSDFETFNSLLETDPATSAPWATADLNSAQFGLKVG